MAVRVLDGLAAPGTSRNWAADGAVYAGNNNFGAVGVPEITLGVSHDGGHTFEKEMNICQIGFPQSCGASTTLGAQCEPLWNDKSAGLGFGLDFVYGDRCVKPDAGGGGGNNASGNAESSCAFSASGRSDGGSGIPAAAALAALAVAAGHMRRRSKSPR